MSTSKQTFDQVKSILGKLDRSIDAARARRLEPPAGAAPMPAPAPVEPLRAPVIGAPRELPGVDLRQARPIRQDDPSSMFAKPMNPRPGGRRF